MKKIFQICLVLFISLAILGITGFLIWTKFAVSQDKSAIQEIREINSEIPDQSMNEDLVQITPTIFSAKTGTFNKIDFQHQGSGEVKLVNENGIYFIEFQDNFKVVNGPDLYIYLSQKQDFKNQAFNGLDTEKTINIGKLANLSGKQKYQITKETFENYNSAVVIWCKAFGLQFSRADLD